MLLGYFCTAAAGASSSEKIGIIDEIVDTKIKEAKGADALSEVLDAVAEKFPLDTNEESPECSAYINELREQIRKKYPATDQELENKYRPIADKNYPIYNIGDQITVIFLLHGKPFTVSGPYYRQDAKFVWVGSKKILKAHLSKRHAPGFDPDQTKQLRESFVAQNIRRYHQQKDFQLKMLKSRNQEKILELRGEIKFNRKWLPPRKVVMEKYAAAFARQNNSIAESIQKAKDSPDYNEKNKILESVIQKYPNHTAIAEAKALLQEIKTVFTQKTEEIKQILAYCSQRNFNYKKLEAEYKINLSNRDFMSLVQDRFRGIPGADKLQTDLRDLQQKLFETSCNAVEQLAINASIQKPQLVIKKLINVGNQECKLMIFPIEGRSKLQIVQMYVDSMGSNTKRLDTLMKLRKQFPNEGTVNAVNTWRKVLVDTSKNLLDATNDLVAIRPVKVSHITSDCFLSHLKGPVVICVWEKIHFTGEVYSGEIIQAWHYEYIPSGDTQEWILK